MYSRDPWLETPDKNKYADRLLDKGLGIHHTDSDSDHNSTVGCGSLRSSLGQLTDTAYGVDFSNSSNDIVAEQELPKSGSLTG